ncbi:MAG: DUF2157 domain-containing protein [bacterium]
MSTREMRWLEREVKVWENEGLVDAATAERLTARYAAAAAESTSWGRVIFGVLGALLVGLGIIALLAANWGDIPRGVRAGIAFAPLTFCVGLYGLGVRRGWDSRAFFEPVGVFWGLSIGAGIALISQTYHIPGEVETFVFTWMVLLLPVLYATRALAAVAGYYVGLLVWVSLAQLAGGVGLFYWPMALLAVPVIRAVRRESAAGIRANLMLWSAALCSTAALGVTLEKSLPGLWMVIYTGAFSTLFLHGMRSERSTGTLWQKPLSTLGACGLGVVLYLLIFEWPWHEIGFQHWREDTSAHAWATGFDYGLGIALPVAAAFLLVLVGRGLSKRAWRGESMAPVCLACAWGAAPFVTAAAYAVATYAQSDATSSAIMMVYLAGLGLATLGEGLAERRLLRVNAGTVILLGVILGKFFCSDVSFTVKGVSFIVCGCLFLGTNLLFSRRLKQSGGAS